MTWPKGYNPTQSKDKTSHNNENTHVLCKNCNNSNPPDSKFCNQCGSKLNPECPKCGNTNNLPNSAFCNQCGTRINTNIINSKLTTPIAEKFKDYNNINRNLILYNLPNYNIKIKYPSNWELFNKEEYEKLIGNTPSGNEPIVIVFFRSRPEGPTDGFLENVGIQITEPTIHMPHKSFIKTNLNELQINNNDFKLIDKVQTTLAGLPAYRTIYHSNGNTTLMVSTKFENSFYNIYFTSEPSKYHQYLSVVEQMISSFEFIRPPKRIEAIIDDNQYNQKDGFFEYPLYQYNIKIKFPSSWVDYSMPNENIVIAFSPLKESSSDPFIALSIFIKDLENPVVDLKEYVELNIQDLRNKYSDFVLHEYYPTTLGGYPSYLMLYSYEGNKYLTIVTIRYNKEHFILYLSTPDTYSKYLSVVEQMISSFEFIKNESQ